MYATQGLSTAAREVGTEHWNLLASIERSTIVLPVSAIRLPPHVEVQWPMEYLRPHCALAITSNEAPSSAMLLPAHRCVLASRCRTFALLEAPSVSVEAALTLSSSQSGLVQGTLGLRLPTIHCHLPSASAFAVLVIPYLYTSC